jgi:hypothetical protein
MPAGITYVLASHKEVCGLSAKSIHARIYISYRQREKRMGCVFSRLSHVQGPVENHAQISRRIFVLKGGTGKI